MNWSSLPQSPAVDAALRRAAAEQVMGWHWVSTYEGEGVWFDQGPQAIDCRRWLRNWNRDDLARVFVAALKHLTRTGGDLGRMWIMWAITLTDARLALCKILDLLNITPPEGLEA